MSASRSIEIAGGGLAGLSLGLALARAGCRVELCEAGSYPRHKVCGEFISGLDPWTVEQLKLAPFLDDALRHREVTWFRRSTLIQRYTLPEPALAISRHLLDQRLAEEFVAAGGLIHTGKRLDLKESKDGRIEACGRRASSASEWIGLKCHAYDFGQVTSLEMHLGADGYVGLCALPGNEVNVSGLFKLRPNLKVDRATALTSYLHATGLTRLAEQLETASIDPASYCAVAALDFSIKNPVECSSSLRLGDAFVLIPPFTGNGMSMAFQSAALALHPVLDWAQGGTASWPSTVAAVNKLLRKRFRRRLSIASRLHLGLLDPFYQLGLSAVARSGLLPFNLIYKALR